ncbi:MAG: hypothetical protein AAGD18_18615 [Actinomycetota bacterium]
MSEESVDVAVPYTIWQATIDPAVDTWSSQQGLPRPEIRERGRGQQVVYRVPKETAEAIFDRIDHQSTGLGDAVLRTRTRAWVRKARGALTGAPQAAPRRRRADRRSETLSAEVSDAVRHYLELVDTGAPPLRTSGRSEATVRDELAEVDQRLEVTDDVLARLDLLSTRRRLLDELEPHPVGTPDELETAFVRHAARFAEAKGYGAEVFRDFGVTDDVLRRAALVTDTETEGA